MIRIDGRKTDQQIAFEIKLAFFTDVVLEIGPKALKLLQAGEGGWQEKDFWMIFALLLAADHHPKCTKSKAANRPFDKPGVRQIKDVQLLVRVGRHLLPNGKGLIEAMKKESIPPATFYRSKKREPELWQQIQEYPGLAAKMCDVFGIKSRKVTIK